MTHDTVNVLIHTSIQLHQHRVALVACLCGADQMISNLYNMLKAYTLQQFSRLLAFKAQKDTLRSVENAKPCNWLPMVFSYARMPPQLVSALHPGLRSFTNHSQFSGDAPEVLQNAQIDEALFGMFTSQQ